MPSFEFPRRAANEDTPPDSEGVPSLDNLAEEASMTPKEYIDLYREKKNVSNDERYRYPNDTNPNDPHFTPDRTIHRAIVKEQQALTDTLTGLSNRRAFDNFIENYASIDEHRELKPHMFFIDFDDFKSVNDLPGGHTTGDAAIKHVASIIQKSLRKESGDTAYRYGGDEFTVVVNTKTSDEALSIAERIRKNVYTSPFMYTEGEKKKEKILTLSIGAAPIEANASLAAKKSDIAAEASKAAGKNCVHHFSLNHEGSDPILFSPKTPSS